MRQAGQLKRAPIILLLLALIAAPAIRAAADPAGTANNPAATALAHYLASTGEAHPWDLETVDILASLPRLQKASRLRAIRRLLPVGKPQYQVLESSGDDTVRRQVIGRYLSADLKASEIPASLVAITPANYKFHYKGSADTGGRVAYIFQITPRKKREGLIQGELWLDADTGAAVRESGRLVKTPSLFLKHVDIVREIAPRNTAEPRITHLTVATRLIGVAELTILERPYDASDELN